MKKTLSLFIFCLGLITPINFFVLASDQTNEDAIPIKSEIFQVKVLRTSSSNRVYLLELPASEEIPSSLENDELLLLKKEDQSVMATQVISIHFPSKQLTVKKIKSYSPYFALEINETYDAVHKIADVLPPLPAQMITPTPPAPQGVSLPPLAASVEIASSPPPQAPDPMPTLPVVPDTAPPPPPTPLPEIASSPQFASSPHEQPSQKLEVLVYDKELDTLVEKPEAQAYDKVLDSFEEETKLNELEKSIEEHLDTQTAHALDDLEIIDQDHHWITSGFGIVQNYGPPATGGTFFFTAFNLRYAHILHSMPFLFFHSKHLQDSAFAEVGGYFYKTLGYASSTDTYSILGFSAAMRYNLFFSHFFGIFFSGGIIRHTVLISAQTTTAALSNLNSIFPILGTGIFIQVGPSWVLRFDLGYDSITGNICLKF